MFDTRKQHKRLIEAGFSDPQSEAVVDVATAVLDCVATKADLRLLETKFEAQFEAIDSRFDAMEARFEAKFDAVDAKFDTIESRFDAVDAKFDAADAKFDAIESRFAAFDTQLGRLWGMMVAIFVAVVGSGVAYNLHH